MTFLGMLMAGRYYQAYEYILRSEIVLPGAIDLGEAENFFGIVDIEIILGEAALPDPVHQEGPWRYQPGKLLFESPAAVRYLCEEGGRIIVEASPGADRDSIAIFLIATALPALLWMRDDLVLHASGIVLEGSDVAIAVCGASGRGKSTVLRDMVQRGCAVVGDDTLRLRSDRSGFVASGLPASFYWSEEGSKDRPAHGVASGKVLPAMPLGGVLILDWPRGEMQFRKITGVEALPELLLQRHRPRVPRLLGNERNFLARIAKLAAQGVYLWRREEGAIALSAAEVAHLTNISRINRSPERWRRSS